ELQRFALRAQLAAHFFQRETRLGRLATEILELGLLLGGKYRARSGTSSLLQRVELLLRLAEVALEVLDLAEIRLLRPRLHVADTDERPRGARAAAQLDQIGIAGELVDQRLREGNVAVPGNHDPLAEDLLDLHRRAVVDEVAVSDQHHGVVGRRLLERRRLGLGLGALHRARFAIALLIGLGLPLGERGLEFSRKANGERIFDVRWLKVPDGRLALRR